MANQNHRSARPSKLVIAAAALALAVAGTSAWAGHVTLPGPPHNPGEFGPSGVTFPPPSFITTLTGDFNGDGLMDLFMPGHCTPQRDHEVHLAGTPGTFTLTQTIASSVCVDMVGNRLADIDQDGDLDILLQEYGGGSAIHILLNGGMGTFSHGPVIGPSAPTQLQDYDGDGDDDIVAQVHGGYTVYFNDGAGGFATSTHFPLPGVGWYNALAVGDLDNDGDIDAIIGLMFKGNPTRVFLNDGAGTYALGQVFGSGMERIRLADFDGDGAPDLVASHRHHQGEAGDVWLGNGDGTFAHQQDLFLGHMWNLHTEDVDNNGHVDVVWGSFGVKVFYNQGGGVFAPVYEVDTSYQQAHHANLVDWNGDGYLDVTTPKGVFLNNYLDTDGDGLIDWEEVHVYGSDPANPDTDADGLGDWDEVYIHGTDPADPDTDGDLYGDGTEVACGSDPTTFDFPLFACGLPDELPV